MNSGLALCCELLQRINARKRSICRNQLISSLKHVPKQQLLNVSVSARRAVTITLDVALPGSVLSWYFTLDYGDIDFWISCENVEVIRFYSCHANICRSVFSTVI